MANAPNVVLAFKAVDGHRSFALTNEIGDYLGVLEGGRYCIAAYTHAGKKLRLKQSQMTCITIQPGKDSRLDVMLLPEGQ